jgi:hypothetical protein
MNAISSRVCASALVRSADVCGAKFALEYLAGGVVWELVDKDHRLGGMYLARFFSQRR